MCWTWSRQPVSRQSEMSRRIAAAVERVLRDDEPQRGGAAHCFFHHRVVAHIRTVVGEERSPRLGERLEVRHLAAEPSLGDAGGGEQERGAFAKRGARLKLMVDDRGGIARRRGVGHGDNRGESAARGGGESGRGRLRRRRSRVAEVDVHVHEARQCEDAHPQPTGVTPFLTKTLPYFAVSPVWTTAKARLARA